MNLKQIYVNFLFKPQLPQNLDLQKKRHFDVQPLMAHSNMKFAQCTGSTIMELLMNLIFIQAWPEMMN
jgi:hypothetical protein